MRVVFSNILNNITYSTAMDSLKKVSKNIPRSEPKPYVFNESGLYNHEFMLIQSYTHPAEGNQIE